MGQTLVKFTTIRHPLIVNRAPSKGERVVMNVFKELGWPYLRECTLINSKRPYDFYFRKGRDFLLEVDGQQHFHEKHFYNKKGIKERQKIDIDKTKEALDNNYSMIRLDYTLMKKKDAHHKVKDFLQEVIKTKKRLILSNPEMYKWLENTY